MRTAMLITVLFGAFAMLMFSGCQGGAIANVVKQQMEELVQKLDTVITENEQLKGKVAELDAAMTALKTNHPEFFEIKPAAPAPTETKPATTTKPATETKPTPTKKTKGGRGD